MNERAGIGEKGTFLRNKVWLPDHNPGSHAEPRLSTPDFACATKQSPCSIMVGAEPLPVSNLSRSFLVVILRTDDGMRDSAQSTIALAERSPCK